MTDIKLPPLPEWMSNYTIPADGFEYDKNVMLVDRMHDYARAAVLADRQQRGGDVIDDMRAAVRFAPSSAYWSERLREFFGPDAREGIDALEKQLREARPTRQRRGGGVAVAPSCHRGRTALRPAGARPRARGACGEETRTARRAG